MMARLPLHYQEHRHTMGPGKEGLDEFMICLASGLAI